MSRWVWIAFSSIFVVVGLVIMGFGINSLSRASDSESWPSAEGVVISSEVVEGHRSRDSGTTYSAEILYDYVVNGETPSGNSIKFGEMPSGNSSPAPQQCSRPFLSSIAYFGQFWARSEACRAYPVRFWVIWNVF